MKIVQINATCGCGSTGKICVAVSKMLTKQEIENYILYTQGKNTYPLGIKYSNEKYIKVQALCSRVLGNYGFNSVRATIRLIRELDTISPDIVHLHNIHGHDCDLERLFQYLRQRKIKIYWTFHDCWAFTGYCTHFTIEKCMKWKESCGNCAQYKKYSWLFDKSEELLRKKERIFSGLDLTIVTPSNWLADLVHQSFLYDYPVRVINNGIDLAIFKPTESDFRKKYHLEDKYIILGVAFGWGYRKGLDVFIELSQRLEDDYKVVLVGMDKNTEQFLPRNIIGIHRTQDQKELAAIYTAADVFVNPTREENYPTVNMEAIACGTPVITFDAGGSSEMLDDKCGIVISNENVIELEKSIRKFKLNNPFLKEDLMKKRQEYDQKERFLEYVKLYENNN